MKISFDEDDLKLLERSLMRALVRAARVIAREGVFTATAAAAAATIGIKDVVETDIPAPAPEPEAEPTPVRGSWSDPPFGAAINGGNYIPDHRATRPKPKVDDPPPVRAKRRSARDILKTVADRPVGYIDTDEARRLIANSQPPGRGALSYDFVNTWVIEKQVEAIIVAGVKPPTKGLPGRLMVSRESLLRRNRLRLENRDLAPSQRAAAPTV